MQKRKTTGGLHSVDKPTLVGNPIGVLHAIDVPANVTRNVIQRQYGDFFDYLVLSGDPAKAALMCGLNPFELYALRDKNPIFAEMWEIAYEQIMDSVEAAMIQSAREGSVKAGAFLLKGRRQKVYQQQKNIGVHVDHTIKAVEAIDAQLISYQDYPIKRVK